MDVPSLRPSDTDPMDQLYLPDPLYANERSLSGHLIPYSPTQEGHQPQLTPVFSASDTSLPEEPSPVNHGTSLGGHPPSPDILISRAASPLHGSESNSEHFRGRTPSSSRRPSVSPGKSPGSRKPTLRASYREHHSSSRPPSRRHSNADDPDSGMIHARFCPMSVKGILRYENRKFRPSNVDCKIQAMSYDYPETRRVPEGWTACQHPDGALYYVHDESKTFTEVNICDTEIHQDVDYLRCFLHSELETEINKRNISESLSTEEVELVLEPRLDELGLVCCYYFVNSKTRTLFWLDDWEASEVFKTVKGISSSHHKGLAIQAQYWCAMSPSHVTDRYLTNSRSHCCLYPNFCRVTEQLRDEALGMIIHAMSNHFISNRSTSPLNSQELQNHLTLIERINPTTHQHAHSAVVIARVMHIFYNNYFSNFNGEECARLAFDQTVHGWRYYPSLFMTFCAPMLFMIPVNRVRMMHRIFVDGVANKQWWNAFITRLNSRLQASNLLATVLLNINVGLLPRQSGPGTSIQLLFINMSMVASLASVILGLVFMGQNRTEEPNVPFHIANFLRGLRHEKHGLEILAIVWSLPHAFLMWSVIFFLASFVIQWYYPASMISRVIVGCFMGMATLLAAWCIWIARDRRNFWWFQPGPDPKQMDEEELTEKDDDKHPSSFGDPKLGFLYGTVAPLTLRVPRSRRHVRHISSNKAR